MHRIPQDNPASSTRIPQRAVALLLAVLVALQPGCASLTPQPPKTEHQAAPGKVAVIAAAQEPEIRFEGFARGAGEGAARGAGTTFLECTSSLGHGSCSGAFCGAVVILWLGVCGVASLVGGAAGAAAAPDTASIRAAEAGLPGGMEMKTIQDSLRDQVVTTALAHGTTLASVSREDLQNAARTRDYPSLADKGADTVLEVALTKAGTQGAGINAPLWSYMEARIRLVRTRDNAEVFSSEYLYQGERLTLAEWSANRSERLLRALKTGYETLGEHIYESVFLLYPFPDRDPHGAGFLSAAFGLAPLYPPTRGQLTGDRLIGDTFEWFAVDSVRPTLRWQAFPRETDIAAAPEDMKRVRNVSYELVVARERNLVPAETVYRRSGLAKPEHTLATALASGARYFWTVRARFELDGRERVTEWSSTHFIAREKITAPSRFSYRFRTPR
ncbi:MAG TPA: hypothetical protein VLT92_05535 [Burkholderiales bacterium]|nr:hypothetical protein [Burkholderiales bacterium]